MKVRIQAYMLIILLAVGALISACGAPSATDATPPVGGPGEMDTPVSGTPTPPTLLFTPLPPLSQRTPIPTPMGRTPSAKPEQKTPTTAPKASPTKQASTATPSPSKGTPSTATPAATNAAKGVKISLREGGLDLGNVEIGVGRIVLTLENKGTSEHAVAIKGTGVDIRTDRVPPGGSITREFTVTQAGRFELSCPIDDHKQKGETGTITVK